MDKKIMIIAIVAAVVLVIAAAAIVLSHQDQGETKETKKGWYAWDPQTMVLASSNVAPSPYWDVILGQLYENIYGEKPDYTKYTKADVPKDYMKYDSLVSHDSNGNLVVTSKYRLQTGEWHTYDTTYTSVPTGMIGSGSYAICLYYAICAQMGVDPSAHNASAVSKMWSMAYGGDSSLYEKLEMNYNIPIAGFSGTELTNPAYMNDNKDSYVNLISKLTADGKTPVWICSGSSPRWENGGEWLKGVIEEQGGYSLLLSISTFEDCLAEIEAICYIFGYGDYAQDLIDDLRLKMYTLDKLSEQKVKAMGKQYTGLGIYTNNDWTFASNSGIGVMFELLHVKNVYTLADSGNWEAENVIKAQPQIIVFCASNPKTVDWNQAMRVPTE